MKQLTRYLAYPLTMVLAFAVFTGLEGHAPLIVRTFGAVLCGAALVIALEAYIPYRREWQPGIKDFVNDGSYALFVQILLPKLLTIGFLLVLAWQFQRMDGIWPHRWPVLAQVLLMVMISDFLRYWLHRFFHTSSLLWRLHEVHHSPDHLYWLNASRFHPVEKTVQYLVDGLPYVMLGISPEVLAAFFVFYEVNGFYQHGNMDARFGLLN
ncbi:MAG: sterol desaturase family protein, partial [Rhodothermales bacterium]